jgi:hypothetical protein
MSNQLIEQTAFGLFCKEIILTDHDEWRIKEKDMKILVDKWKRLVPSLNEEHFGDCTNDAMSCKRCYIEGFYGEAKLIINTIKEQK